MDFFEPRKKIVKGISYVAPKFIICRSKDLMIRGRDFYAIWDEEHEKWSKDQDDAIRIIDKETKRFIQEKKDDDEAYIPQYMWDSDSGVIDRWNKYVQKQMRDNYYPLDNKVIFSNTDVKREDYSTHRLNYPLQEGPIDAYEELISTLYEPEERKKLEWAIGSIVAGDSTWIQKFIVIVGDPGTGKSTFFKILRMLFPGYYATINAKALGDGHSAFALEPLKNDPLVAIEDDADLSRIIDNTRLNSLVSHEPMTVNEKFKAQYENVFHAFIFLGTNKEVKITDSASGLTRRLIDVKPSGEKLEVDRYNEVMKQIPFELGGICYHCLKVYQHNKKKYNDYIPVRMLRATNLIYEFLEDNVKELLKDKDGCRLFDLWNAYKRHCEFSNVEHPHSRQEFRNEMNAYFKEYLPEYEIEPGVVLKQYYKGFRWKRFGLKNPYEVQIEDVSQVETKKDIPDWLILDSNESIFDELCADYPAQYATEQGTPMYKWDNVKTSLRNISSDKLHYVRIEDNNHIIIDFDLKNSEGKKDKLLNIEAASHFPPTYAEWSKSGEGLHLHYIYDGDVSKLSNIYDDNIEIKVFNGKSSLRRQFKGCNKIDISHINSGLPFKGDGKKVISEEGLKNERALRTFIKRNLNKEYHNNTSSSISFIFKGLEDAYNGDMEFDVRDMRPAILSFAANSSNQSDKCLKQVSKMHFCSKNFEGAELPEPSSPVEPQPIVFYDVEVFPNCFIVCWKRLDDKTEEVVRLINPTPKEVEGLYRFNLIGFNNRKYDAHITYARMMGYTNEQLYKLSQRIINSGEKFDNNCFFSEAFRSDYADMYDICTKKQSLKKWEIELEMTHMENNYPWDEPLPEEHWKEVADYCANDVLATEQVYLKCQSDFSARLLLSELSGLPVIDTNRQHITRIIFGKEKKPNLVYTELATGKQTYLDGTPYRKTNKFINAFPGYEFNEFGIADERYTGVKTSGKSLYLGEDPSEGGYVYTNPGAYWDVWCFDVSGMHPASIIAMDKFGEYTQIYKEIRDARLLIKHGEYEKASKLLDGKLAKYLQDKDTAKQLAGALKLILNSTYGFCSAGFENPFRDPRDKDNIVAKRGALFMITLKEEVIKKGFTVIHCKTDSIKVVNPTKELCDFIFDFGRKYGYEFEVEHKFDRICLVNKAAYVCKYTDEDGGNWDATAAEFAHPYIFKTLFTKEKIEFKDYCETKQVAGGALYLDMNEALWDSESDALQKEYDKLTTKRKKEDIDEERYKHLASELEKRHNYIFIGRIGQFVPVKPGCGGGLLVVKRGDKYSSAAGTKGYRWLEANLVKELGKEADIDKNYYRQLVDDAKASIEEYCNFEDFITFNKDDMSVPF